MVRGVLFGEKHSFRDWGLILAARPEISLPEVRTVYVDVPGSDGSIDLTETLTGEVTYKRRNVKFEFSVIEKREKWHELYTEIADYLHGQNMHVILDEDNKWYYTGRLSINEWQSDIASSTIVIQGSMDPYKYEINEYNDWLWDTFNFETDIIREYNDIVVDRKASINVYGLKNSVIPEFYVNSDDENGMGIIFKNVEYHVPDGRHRVLGITIRSGDNVIRFKGNGTVSIVYKGGRL